MSPTDMWTAWNNSPLVLPERAKEIEPVPKPKEEKGPPRKPPKKIPESLKSDASKDLVRECTECGRKFVWTVGEQKFYKEKKLSPPRTCSKECREHRRKEYLRKEEFRELSASMQPSEPFRTGSRAGSAVHVSGGVVAEISSWTMDNIEKGYTNRF